MPVFSKQFYSDIVPENIELHTPLSVAIQAESPLGRKLIYTIIKGNELEEFSVDFNTGMFLKFAFFSFRFYYIFTAYLVLLFWHQLMFSFPFPMRFLFSILKTTFVLFWRSMFIKFSKTIHFCRKFQFSLFYVDFFFSPLSDLVFSPFLSKFSSVSQPERVAEKSQ